MSLGRRIRELRESRGLTQEKLGGEEFSKSFISMVERGKAMPAVDTLALLARRLGASVDALLAHEGHAPEMAAHSLLALARSSVESADTETANRYLEMVAFLVDRHGLSEPDREMRVLRAEIAIKHRDYDAAWARLEDAGHAAERAGDRWRVGRVLSLMGLVQLRRRNFAEARKSLENALGALRAARAGRDPVRVDTLISLGTVQFYLGDLDAARRRYEEAAASYVGRRDHRLRGKALWGLGAVLRKQGRFEEARQRLLEAKDAFEAAEELTDMVRVLQNIGRAYLEEGEAKQALRHFEHALRVMERLDRPMDRASVLTETAKALHAVGDISRAHATADQALQAAREADDPVEVDEAQVVISRVLLTESKLKPAIAGLRQAVAGFTAREMHQRLRELAREFGPLLMRHGAHAEAAELMAHTLEGPPGDAAADRAMTTRVGKSNTRMG